MVRIKVVSSRSVRSDVTDVDLRAVTTHENGRKNGKIAVVLVVSWPYYNKTYDTYDTYYTSLFTQELNRP